MENYYIINTGENRLFCFYHIQKTGLVYKIYENGKWSKVFALLKNARKNFSVSLDQNGMIYLFCQDEVGNLALCTNPNGQWHNRVILKNQGDKIYPIQIHPIITETGLSLIYNLPSPEDKSNYIVFQKLGEDGQWGPASRIDKFYALNRDLFQVQMVSQEHLLLFYLMRTPENNLGYREITPQQQSGLQIFHTTSYQIVDYSFLTM